MERGERQRKKEREQERDRYEQRDRLIMENHSKKRWGAETERQTEKKIRTGRGRGTEKIHIGGEKYD